MKSEIKYFANSLKNYSKGLKKRSILVNKPWVLIESDLGFERLLFKKNKDLVISNDGVATIGKWDYHPEVKSLFIDKDGEKILLKELFVNEAVIVLEKGSSKENLVVIVNEKIIPDLNVIDYLNSLRKEKANILVQKLDNGEELEIGLNHGVRYPSTGNPVSINKSDVPDGLYESKLRDYYIKDNEIVVIYYNKNYELADGTKIIIKQKSPKYFDKGDEISISDMPIKNGQYVLKSKDRITVQDSKIIEIKIKFGFF